jgi:hypothetical protein
MVDLVEKMIIVSDLIGVHIGSLSENRKNEISNRNSLIKLTDEKKRLKPT